MSNAKDLFEKLWSEKPIVPVSEVVTDTVPDWYKSDAQYYFNMGVNAFLGAMKDEPVNVQINMINLHLKFTGRKND